MVMVVKRLNVLLVLLICVLSYMTYNLYYYQDIQTSTVPSFNKKIVIDAGHGEPDGGAVSPSGVKEKDLNLSVAKKLAALIKKSGAKVVLTRDDDAGIYSTGKKTIKEKKVSDLHNRKKIMDESGADVFISIHMNKFEQSQYHGAQVFYSTNDEDSKIIAEIIQKELKENIDNNNNREVKPTFDSIYLLKQATIPAILVECGFLSNPQEAELLQTDSYQDKLAWSIYIGLIKYFNMQ